MGNSFQFIDVIFFAMIAIFLILRLRGVLGKRDGNEGTGFLDLFKQDLDAIKPERENDSRKVVKLSKGTLKDEDLVTTENNGKQDSFKKASIEAEGVKSLTTGILEVQSFEPNFNDEDFLVGARVAFEMILKAFALADVDELKPLVSHEVYGNFAKAIQDREQAGHVMEDTLVGIMKSEIVEAYMEGNQAHITIKYTSEQVNAVRNGNGDVVEGDASVVLTVVDFWTFARDTKNLDPNWLLVATRSLE
jgi:predicted lipid-binding transport protein (Tim44 family)